MDWKTMLAALMLSNPRAFAKPPAPAGAEKIFPEIVPETSEFMSVKSIAVEGQAVAGTVTVLLVIWKLVDGDVPVSVLFGQS